MNWTQRIARFVLTRGALPLPERGKQLLTLTAPKQEVDLEPLKTRSDKLGQFAGWVYAAVSFIAGDVAHAEGAMWRKSGMSRKDWERLPETAVPPELERPNALSYFSDALETTMTHLDLAGESWWRLIFPEGDEGARPVGWEVVYPNWVDEPWVQEGVLRGWKISVPGHAQRTVPADQMAWIRYPHPTDPLGAVAPVESFVLSHQLDQRTRGYGATLMANNAVPLVVVTSEQSLEQSEADLLAERWMDRHSQRPGYPAVMGKGADAKVLGMTLDRLGLEVISKMTRDQVFAAYGMPASVLGLGEEVNRATAFVHRQTYGRNVLDKRLSRLERPINRFLLPAFRVDTTRLAYLFDSMVEEDEDFLLEKATKLVSGGMIVVNQGLQMIGEAPNPDGNVYLLPSSVRRVPLGKLNEEDTDEPKSVQRGTHIFEDPLFEVVDLRWRQASANLERRFTGELRRLFSIEQKEVAKTVQEEWEDISAGVRVRLSALPGSVGEGWPGCEALAECDPPVVRDAEGWLEETWTQARGPIDNALAKNAQAWQGAFNDHIFRSSEAGWSLFKQQIPEAPDFAAVRQRALNRARRISAQLVTDTSATTQKALRRIVIDGVARNESAAKVAGRIRAQYDTWKGARANTIARTETGGHVNFGEWITAKETDDRLTDESIIKIWLTSFNNSRDTHVRAHRQERLVNRNFDVGAASLRFPLDRGPASEVVNCQCTMAFRKTKRAMR